MAQIALHEKRRAILVTTSVFGQQIRTRETKKKKLDLRYTELTNGRSIQVSLPVPRQDRSTIFKNTLRK